MNSIYLWIDDERPKPEGYTHHVKTSKEALEFLQGLGDDDFLVVVSFDHDLGFDPTDGHPKLEGDSPSYDDVRPVVRWMLKNQYFPQVVVVHSRNPIGARWIYDSFKFDGPPGLAVARAPFVG